MKKIGPTGQYIDIGFIKEILDNDDQTLVLVLNEFMNVAGADLKQMQEAYCQRDLNTIANIAHKFKSTFRYFGAIQCERSVEQLEILARSTNKKTLVKPLLDEVTQCCQKMMQEVKELLASFDQL